MRPVCLILLLALSFSAFADKDFSSWRKFSQGKLISETNAVAPGTTATIGLHVTLADKWHTYWVNAGDSGAAIRLDFKNGPGVKVKAVHMPVPERTKSSGLISFDYAKEVVFPIEIEVGKEAGLNAHIKVDAEWLVCEEVCIPAIDTLTLDLPVKPLEEIRPSEHLGLMQKFMARVPPLEPNYPKFDANGGIVLRIPGWEAGQSFVDFFNFRGSGVNNELPTSEIKDGALVMNFKAGNVKAESPERVGVLVYNSPDGRRAVQFGKPKWEFTEAVSSGGSAGDLWWMLLSAFIGGLILNLMPCVFPILSLKLLSILKISAKSKHIIRKQNLGYVAGVMASFLLIALLLAGLRSAGHLVGWGFQLQSPVFLAALVWLFVLLSLNLLGLFDIDFIDSGAGGKLTRLGGFWGSFFTGVLAVVVASPCTAPFMGVALGFGISQPTPVLMAVFLTLGFGLAFPYALMIVVPSAMWFLPKPGPWMDWLKKIMAVPLLLTVVWLLWVMNQIVGMPGVMASGLAAAVLALLVLIKVPRKVAVGGVIVCLVALIAFVNSLGQTAEVSSKEGWEPYSAAKLEQLQGKNVFVNMTADWCLTCKVNERLVFDDPEVQTLLRDKGVTLVMGDWTRRSEEITRFLTSYNRVGVPFYVLFSARSPKGRVLPEVMTKSSFIEEIKNEFP